MTAQDVPRTAVDVIAWVGYDRGRAGVALAVEQDRDTPRKTVVAHIDDVLAGGPAGMVKFRHSNGTVRSFREHSVEARIRDRSRNWARV